MVAPVHAEGHVTRHRFAGGEREWNSAWAIDFWLNKAHTPKEKLVVGIPTYGMSFTLEDRRKNGLNAKANGGGEKGKYTGESGILSYYEVSNVNIRILSVYLFSNMQLS